MYHKFVFSLDLTDFLLTDSDGHGDAQKQGCNEKLWVTNGRSL